MDSSLHGDAFPSYDFSSEFQFDCAFGFDGEFDFGFGGDFNFLSADDQFEYDLVASCIFTFIPPPHPAVV